jgi:hypothetical protein
MTGSTSVVFKRCIAAFIVCCAVIGVAGCNPQEALEKMAPRDDDAAARRFFDQISRKEFDAIEAQAAEELRTPQFRAALEQTYNELPKTEPKKVSLIGYGVFSNQSGTMQKFDYEVDYGSQWDLRQVVFKKTDSGLKVAGFHTWHANKSLIESNRFNLENKGATQWIALVFLVFNPLFIITSLIFCARTKGLRRKWAWLIFVALGITCVTVNWSTGEWMFQLVQFQLLGAGAFQASAITPFIVKVGLPVGATWFWWKRHKLKAIDQSQAAPNAG